MNTMINKHLFSRVRKGFTLLEVLVAMAISSLVYIGAYTLMDSVLNTNEKVSEKRIALEKLQRCFYFLQQDIEQIIPRSVRTEFGESSAAIEYNGLSGQFEFTRLGWRNPVNRPRSTMQRVSYLVEDNILYRQHWHVLDRVQDSEPKKNELLGDVENFELRFYDPVQKEWVSDWGSEVEASNSASINELSDDDIEKILPSAIEFKLTTKTHGEITRIFSLVDNPRSSASGGEADD